MIRRFCRYDYPQEVAGRFIVYITTKILNDNQCKLTCSEPTLEEVASEISSFTDDPDLKSGLEEMFMDDLMALREPYDFDKFMCSLDRHLDKGNNEMDDTETDDVVLLDKTSALGLFVRKCCASYEQLVSTHLSDIHDAFLEFLSHKKGDSELLDIKDETAIGWLSDYNVKEFLKSQAEQIEITGTSNINAADLHKHLDKIEKQLPSLTNISQVRYLNYIRSKEYTQSLYYLNRWSDGSLDKGLGIQYAQLNIGILEYKFGHLENSLSALNEALVAARFNKDHFCLQEIQYWIELCRKGNPVNESNSYTDTYLEHLKGLSNIRNMIRNGYPSRNIFEGLYGSLIDIIANDIKYIDRVQFLITSHVWKGLGYNVMAGSYLKLAQHLGGETIEEIENTVVTNADKLHDSGNTEKALEELNNFVNNYRDESDLLMGWRQLKARILRQSSNKRTFEMTNYDSEVLQVPEPPHSQEYFNALHDRVVEMIEENKVDEALSILNSAYEFIQETHQISQLSPNLILQATIHLNSASIKTAIPILEKAMKLAKKHHDSKNYYMAVIRLSEVYVCFEETEYTDKAIYMLENIFPKVLQLSSKLLESELNLTYARALVAKSITTRYVKGETTQSILEYIEQAEIGFKELNLEGKILKTLKLKAFVCEKL